MQPARVVAYVPVALLDDFKRFVVDAESGTQYAAWQRDNGGYTDKQKREVPLPEPTPTSDAGKWFAYRDAILAGGRPTAPTMATAHGRELIDAGLIYLNATAPAPAPEPTPLPPPPPPPSGYGNGMGGVQEGSYTYGAALKLLDVFITDLNGTKAVADLPSTRCFLYRSCCSVNTGYDTSIPWADANSHGWLLHDANGNVVTNKQFPSNNIGDISNPDFSAALAAHAASLAKAYGFKGVWFDDAVASSKGLLSALPAGWSEAQWYTRMVAHLQRVAYGVATQGLEVAFNANGFISGDGASDTGANHIKFWQDIAAVPVTGLGFTAEYWQQSPADPTVVRTLGASWYQHWDTWRQLHTWCNSHGVAFLPMGYYPNGQAEADYLRGSFLLDYNGGRSAEILSHAHDAPVYKALGAASGAAVENPAGVWTRQFANGKVVVDSVHGTATIS